VLEEEGGFCLFKYNLGKVCIYFKIRSGVSAIWRDFRGGKCNFP